MPFCKQCGKEIAQDARFCPYCGADQISPVPQTQAGLETKNTGLAAVLALILGIFGLWGVGHIYVGKIGRGLALLILGIILEWGLGFFVFFGMVFGGIFRGYQYGVPELTRVLFVGVITLAIWALITLAIFIWQIYDAYKLAKYYNEYVQQYRKAPW
ncbi:MAG: zinc-ribbon domain-containing protein [Candidatus Bathyarchaeia archaeon]